jgi:hypothetical protein
MKPDSIISPLLIIVEKLLLIDSKIFSKKPLNGIKEVLTILPLKPFIFLIQKVMV